MIINISVKKQTESDPAKWIQRSGMLQILNTYISQSRLCCYIALLIFTMPYSCCILFHYFFKKQKKYCNSQVRVFLEDWMLMSCCQLFMVPRQRGWWRALPESSVLAGKLRQTLGTHDTIVIHPPRHLYNFFGKPSSIIWISQSVIRSDFYEPCGLGLILAVTWVSGM